MEQVVDKHDIILKPTDIPQSWDNDFTPLIPGLKESKANRLAAAKKSFRFFIYLYMSHWITIKPAQFQKDAWDDAHLKRAMMLHPRGFGKSVIWSICYPLWKLLCNPDEMDLKYQFPDVFLISKAARLAEKWIKIQKRELLENNRILLDFNPIPAKDCWKFDEYELQGRGHVRAIGVEGQFRGEHPTDTVLDDIEDRKLAKSEPNREALREWFFGDFMGAMRLERNAESGVKIIGNLVHPLGLYNELMTRDWGKTTRYAVYKEDGVTPLWKEYQDEEQLEQLRKDTPESIFMAEYMNQPVISENPTFVRRDFKSYDPGFLRTPKGVKITHREMHLATSLDPAISQKQGADYSALTQWGLVMEDDQDAIYCLEAKRGHWSAPKQITELLIMYEKFPGTAQLIETVGGFNAILQEYRDRCDREKYNIRIIDVVPQTDKGMRANAVTHLFEKGCVYFNHADKQQQLLMDELAQFDYSVNKHGSDDWVDSTTQVLSYFDRLIRRRRKHKNQNKKPIIMHDYTNPIYRGN